MNIDDPDKPIGKAAPRTPEDTIRLLRARYKLAVWCQKELAGHLKQMSAEISTLERELKQCRKEK